MPLISWIFLFGGADFLLPLRYRFFPDFGAMSPLGVRPAIVDTLEDTVLPSVPL